MISQTFYNAATKVLRAVFFGSGSKKKPTYQLIYRKATPTPGSPFEQSQSLVAFGQFPEKTQDGRIVYDLPQEGYLTTIAHAFYYLGYRASEEALKFDKWGIIPKLVSFLRYSADDTIDAKLMNVFNLAFTSTVIGGDNVSFCASNHPIKRTGGTWSNTLGTTAMGPTGLENALIKFDRAVGLEGLLVGLTAEIVLISPELRKTTWETLYSTQEPYTSDNQTNIHKDKNKNLTLVVTSRITTANQKFWFVLAGKGSEPAKNQASIIGDGHGLVYYEPLPLHFVSAPDFDTQGMKAAAGFGLGYGWEYALGGVGSQGL